MDGLSGTTNFFQRAQSDFSIAPPLLGQGSQVTKPALEQELVPGHENFQRDLRPDFSVQQSAECVGNLQQVVERGAGREKMGQIPENFCGKVVGSSIIYQREQLEDLYGNTVHALTHLLRLPDEDRRAFILELIKAIRDKLQTLRSEPHISFLGSLNGMSAETKEQLFSSTVTVIGNTGFDGRRQMHSSDPTGSDFMRPSQNLPETNRTLRRAVSFESAISEFTSLFMKQLVPNSTIEEKNLPTLSDVSKKSRLESLYGFELYWLITLLNSPREHKNELISGLITAATNKLRMVKAALQEPISKSDSVNRASTPPHWSGSLLRIIEVSSPQRRLFISPTEKPSGKELQHTVSLDFEITSIFNPHRSRAGSSQILPSHQRVSTLIPPLLNEIIERAIAQVSERRVKSSLAAASIIIPKLLEEDVPLVRARRVAVVDDNETNQRVNVRMTRNVGLTDDAHIYTAENGIQAMEQLTADTDVMLLDQMMPNMDGIETINAIRAHPEYKDLVVILCSANSEHQEDWADFGFDGYLGKPFTTKQLKNTLLAIQKDNRPDRRWPGREN